MTNTVERFSNRVENYVKYRPGYPKEILEVFRDEMNLRKKLRSLPTSVREREFPRKFFLENGNPVFGVEPNAAMREAAEEFLKDFPNFKSVDGTAENTNLPDRFGRFCHRGAGFSLV